MNFDRLHSDGTAAGTAIAPDPEERISGESTWWVGDGSTGSPLVVNSRTALRSAAFLTTQNVISTDVAVLPLNVFQRNPDGKGKREASEHPIDELLCWSPDGGETTPVRWRQSFMAHALSGNGYAEIRRTGRGDPYSLHLLDPETTRAERVDGMLGYRLGNRDWLPAVNVLHIAGLGYDGVTGYDFCRLLAITLRLTMSAESHADEYFRNGSEPNGVIETPERLKPDALGDLQRGWESKHGQGMRHRTAVLQGGAKFNQTTTDPEKSQLLETRKYQVLDTIRAWRLPPHKAGDYSQSHLANIEASNLDYLMTCLMSWLKVIEQEFNMKLLGRSGYKAGYYVEHNVMALLRGDIMSRYGAYEIAVRNGWLSRDEVRHRENDNPIGKDAGGDLYTVQSQNISLKLVGEATAGPVAAPVLEPPKNPKA